MLDLNTKILIVGLGLIGGSYAEALTDAGYEVGAVSHKRDDIDYALYRGIISHGIAAPEGVKPDPSYIGRFDLIIFALYPKALTAWLSENQSAIKSGALLTDVTGVKCAVVYDVQNMLRSDLEFIGAHPMAGRESSGVRNATKEIFKGANYIVTPTGKNTPSAIDKCRRLGETLGFARISTLSPEEHDEMIGFLSQLTHCIAVSLMVCKDSQHLVDYTGDSFRDLTRIAKINDRMWSELFLLNKDQLLRQMDIFTDKFMQLRDAIEREDSDSIRAMMRLSTERRSYFDIKQNQPNGE